jgi:predicted RNase H-like HicB family nuclease
MTTTGVGPRPRPPACGAAVGVNDVYVGASIRAMAATPAARHVMTRAQARAACAMGCLRGSLGRAGEADAQQGLSVGRLCGAEAPRDIVRTQHVMRNEFTAVFEREGDWYIAYSLRSPERNGQGRTKDEARDSLVDAIALILQDRREDGLRGLPPDAERETVVVK